MSAALIVLYMTPHGAGVSPDSVKYIAVARNLIEGNGAVHLGGDGGLVPLTLWGALYPVILSSSKYLGIDPWQFGRYLNVFLFAINILLFETILYKITNRSRSATLIGTTILLLSPIVLKVHIWIWTEPLALLLGFGSILALQRYLENYKVVDLVVVALLLALGMINRYAAIALPITILISLWILSKGRSVKEKMVDIVIVGAISFAPLSIIMIRNKLQQAGAIGRSFQFNPVALQNVWQDTIYTIAEWTIPGRIPDPYRDLLAIAVGVVWFILISYSMRLRSLRKHQEGVGQNYIPEILYILVIVSILPSIVVNLFFSPGVHVDDRILSLAFIAGTMLTISQLSSLSRSLFAWGWQAPRARVIIDWLPRGAIFLSAILIITMNLVRTRDSIRNSHQDGRGYASLLWQNSKIVDYIRESEMDAFLISNTPDAIYFLTGKPAAMMPKDPPDIEKLAFQQVESDRNNDRSPIWLVYFRTNLRRHLVPSETQMKKELPLSPVYGWDEGSIYDLKVEGGDD